MRIYVSVCTNIYLHLYFLMHNYNVTNMLLIMNFTYSQIMLKILKIKNFQFSFTTLFYNFFDFLLFMFNEGVFKSFKHPSMYPKKKI